MEHTLVAVHWNMVQFYVKVKLNKFYSINLKEPWETEIVEK